MTKLPAVIFDLDNTLADVSHLLEYITGANTDYAKFHLLAEDAKPIDWVVWEMKKWKPEHWVFVMTARQDRYLMQTWEWLKEHEIPYDELVMRGTGDLRSDYEVKREMYLDVASNCDIVHAYDDNPSTVKLWLENGIPTTVIPGYPMEAWGD